MFEEAQLYSTVAVGDDGRVHVQLPPGHPGLQDPAYQARRDAIAEQALAWCPGRPAPRVAYTPDEDRVWSVVCRELHPLHERLVCAELLEAKAALALPEDRVPQLDDVSLRLRALTGWSYVPAAGLVELGEFFGALGDRVFHSTQYVRHPAQPLYTPEPDVVHEVAGHGVLMAAPRFARVKQEAGLAAQRVTTPAALQLIADVFWFSLEFGVVREGGGLRAYGAGLLSSFGEIQELGQVDVRPLDVAAMATQPYDITKYQPVLFAGSCVDEVIEVLGGFFAGVDDDTPARLGVPTSEEAVR